MDEISVHLSVYLFSYLKRFFFFKEMGKGGRHGKGIVGLHLCHLYDADGKYLWPFCAKAVWQQSPVLEGSWRGMGTSWDKCHGCLAFCSSCNGEGALGLLSPVISKLNKKKMNKRMRKGGVVINEGQKRSPGGWTEEMHLVHGGKGPWRSRSCGPREVSSAQCCRQQPSAVTRAWLLQEQSFLPPPAPQAGFPGCQLPSWWCWEEWEPRSHREHGTSLLCVWSPLHKPGPGGGCGKGQSLLGHVAASLSVAVAVAGCFIASRCRLLSLLTGDYLQLRCIKGSLNYLTCKGYLNGKLQTPLHPPITVFNL